MWQIWLHLSRVFNFKRITIFIFSASFKSRRSLCLATKPVNDLKVGSTDIENLSFPWSSWNKKLNRDRIKIRTNSVYDCLFVGPQKYWNFQSIILSWLLSFIIVFTFLELVKKRKRQKNLPKWHSDRRKKLFFLNNSKQWNCFKFFTFNEKYINFLFPDWGRPFPKMLILIFALFVFPSQINVSFFKAYYSNIILCDHFSLKTW